MTLDRSRCSVQGQLDVIKQERMERRIGEFGDGFGNVLAGHFNGDIFVLVKVDSSLRSNRSAPSRLALIPFERAYRMSTRFTSTEQLDLGALVDLPLDVLAVFPHAKSVTSTPAISTSTARSRAFRVPGGWLAVPAARAGGVARGWSAFAPTTAAIGPASAVGSGCVITITVGNGSSCRSGVAVGVTAE